MPIIKRILILLCISFAVLSVWGELYKPTGRVFKYDSIKPSALPGEIGKNLEKGIEHIKGKKCLVTPFYINKSSANTWTMEKYIQMEFTDQITAAGAVIVEADVPALLSKYMKIKPGMKIPYGRNVVKALGKDAKTEIVIAGEIMLQKTHAVVVIVFFEAEKGNKLFQMKFMLKGNDISLEANIPRTNLNVLKWAEEQVGKKVGRGECSDLAMGALLGAGLKKPSVSYQWGTPLEKGLSPLPGDIVQLESAQFGGKTVAHHTIMIRDIISPGVYEIIHQNWKGGAEEGRKVAYTTYDFRKQTGGKILFYRPIPVSEKPAEKKEK